MLRSFKLKIALSSVLLSGALLTGFGLFFIQMSYRVGLDRVDRELRALVDADMRKVQPTNHWFRFDESLKTLFSESAEKSFLLYVTDNTGRVLFASDEWNHHIAAAEIPRPPPVEANTAVEIDPNRDRPFRRKQKNREPAPPPLAIGAPQYITHGAWRIMSIRNPEISLKLAISLEPLNAEIARFRNALLLTVPIALLALIASGWLLARLALRPVITIARTAKKVSALHLDERIPREKADHEFKQLIDVINQMLQRLETSFHQATRFSSDAAHELKTPLTILQGQLEAALQAAADGSSEQRAHKESLDEVQRLKSIIRKLLLLARADSGHLPLNAQPLNLSDLIHELRDDIEVLNPEIEVRAEIQADVRVDADMELLTQVIQNLAGNAVKFSQGESPITLSLTRRDDRVEFTISNRGQTIPEAERAHIFERFYRADQAHGRAIDGSGLGLSLAREIALAHGGTLELADSANGATTFRLTLPR